jgi:energy-coupling factor transporter ATP-binding protein EcfA2
VLADEPTADLDPVSARQVMDFLRAHSRTLVLVTHNAELARGADQLVRLEEGTLEHLQAPPLLERPELTVAVPAASDDQRPWARPPSRWVGALALVLLLALGADLGWTWRERAMLRARAAARRTLERSAMQHLRADISDVARGPGDTYRVTLTLENPFEQPLTLPAPK